MNKEDVKKIVYSLIAIFVAIILVKLFIWLLPVILILLLAYYLYTKMTDKNKVNKKDNKNKKIIIIDEEKGDKNE
ncbi:MAG: hypothetical protein IJI49_03625 [Bacilli bacterium]|nr:hypothetical protein [Bacilli bacterium]